MQSEKGRKEFQNAMMAYLSNFASAGDPNAEDLHHMFPAHRTRWRKRAKAAGGPKSIVFDPDFETANITRMNEEVTFAGAEAEREAWVAAQDEANQATANLEHYRPLVKRPSRVPGQRRRTGSGFIFGFQTLQSMIYIFHESYSDQTPGTSPEWPDPLFP